ncbi:uncharacterized [Tachysurus ichikawai]
MTVTMSWCEELPFHEGMESSEAQSIWHTYACAHSDSVPSRKPEVALIHPNAHFELRARRDGTDRWGPLSRSGCVTTRA